MIVCSLGKSVALTCHVASAETYRSCKTDRILSSVLLPAFGFFLTGLECVMQYRWSCHRMYCCAASTEMNLNKQTKMLRTKPQAKIVR